MRLAPGGARRGAAAPYVQGGAVYVEALAAGQAVRVELFGLAGGKMGARDFIAERAGWNRLEAWPADRAFYWNGVKVHDNRVAHGPATGIGPDQHSGEPLGPTLFGLKLQSEGSDVRFWNIWIKDLNLATADTNVGY